MNPNLHTTLADRLLIVAILLSAIALFFALPRWIISGGTHVQIRSGDKITGTYPLNRDRTLTVHGPLGDTIVRIEGGRARVVSSPCPYKRCVHMGSKGSEGGVIACVPNKVVISVGSGQTDGLDAVSR